jgi:hypothetical protein
MSKLVTATVNHSLDALLELVCVGLQLSPTQHETATDRYGAVSGWLCKYGSPVRLLSPYIFPQGSLLLGTTTKPLKQAEFDLDLVCLLAIDSPSHPGAVYRLIWDRMWDSGMYRPMMKRLPRCIRLDYSGDFHLEPIRKPLLSVKRRLRIEGVGSRRNLQLSFPSGSATAGHD